MATQSEDYKPVNCLFYDQLTDLITLKKYSKIDYKNEYGEFLKTTAIPRDIITEDKKEYLVLNVGDKIRLDRIMKVNDIIPPHVGDNYYQCDC